MVMWGDEHAGECAHGEPALRCRVCGPEAARDFWSDPTALIVAVLAVAGLLWLAPGAAQREAAFEAQQLQEHQQRLEAARPGALNNLQELAADVRAGRVPVVR